MHIVLWSTNTNIWYHIAQTQTSDATLVIIWDIEYNAWMNCFSGFRTEFLKAISVVSSSPSKGMFIDGCYSHCQTGMQETWMRNDSPVLANTVRHYIFLPTEIIDRNILFIINVFFFLYIQLKWNANLDY